MSTLTLQERFDIWADYQESGNKTQVAKDHGVSARTVGRCVDMIGAMSNSELEAQGIKVVEDLEQELPIEEGHEQEAVTVFKAGDKVRWVTPDEVDGSRTYYDNDYCTVSRVVINSQGAEEVHYASDGDYIYKGGLHFDFAHNLEHYVEDQVEEPEVQASVVSFVSSHSAVIVVDGDPRTIPSDHPNFEDLIEAVRVGDKSQMVALSNLPKAVQEITQGKILVKDGVLTYEGYEVDNTLTRYVLERMQSGEVPTNIMNFLENLMENPSSTAVAELFDFIRKTDLPITEDGYFLAYKKVNHDYTDCHSGTIDNSVGEEPSMPRHMVDDVRTNHCSQGLHFCSEGYLTSFGGSRTMILKINPADVVSIPNDYNFAKGRTWKYKVVGELAQGEKIGSLFQEV